MVQVIHMKTTSQPSRLNARNDSIQKGLNQTTLRQSVKRAGFLLLLASLTACSNAPTGPGITPNPTPEIEPSEEFKVNHTSDINLYLKQLNADTDALLNVVSANQKEIVGTPETTTQDITGKGNYTCERTDYSLQQNFDEVAILRPTQGIVWPGALIKANQSLTDGLPEPITLARRPVTLSIDLPGMGAQGTTVVENPTNSSTQAAVDNALEWWNANAYQEGYVNAASSSFQWDSSYAAEQTGLSTGLNLDWASGEVSSALSTTSSETKKVVTGVFKQAFYTATADTPDSPAAVFANDITTDAVQSQIDADEPAAYIANVTYGRIISVQMETTATESTEDIEGAFQYSMGVQNASGEIESTYKEILQKSTFTVVTLGGNAAVATEAITNPADSYQGMLAVIKGDNAIYSRSNPGVPISYTVRNLDDNSLARLGATTEYTTTDCRLNTAAVTVNYKGIKVLGDCRLFEGYFHWRLRAGDAMLSDRPRSQALLGDDVGGTYLSINKKQTFNLPMSPGSAITLQGDVYEKLTNTHFPQFVEALRYEDNWKAGNHSRELNPTGKVGISACNVRLDYAVTVR